MGRFHCIDSDCATVWVKEEEGSEVIRGDEVWFRISELAGYMDENALANDQFFITKVKATHYTLEDLDTVTCYPFDGDLTAQNVRTDAENPLPGNEVPSKNRYDTVAEPTYNGSLQRYTADRVREHTYESRGKVRVIARGILEPPDYTERRVVFSGDVDWIFWTLHEIPHPNREGEWLTLYDLNVIYPGTCTIVPVYENGDYYREIPEIQMLERKPDTGKLTIYNVDGIQGNNQVYELWRRPSYLSLRNPKKIKIPDRWKVDKIEKLPYLERLEVVPHAYEQFGFNLYQKDIPNECLNIYLNDITGAITVPGIPYPGNPWYNSWEFIAQFCSLPGEPPLEYHVVCNCDIQCPPGTCAVQCGEHICCYGSDGIAVTSIQIN